MIQPKVALIVLSWNNADILPACFDSIQALDYPHIKTVLVDNASTDNSVEMTRNKYPWVEIVESPRNGGFTEGNNIGIRHALKDEDIQYIGLINSDATLDTAWLSTIVRFACNKPKGAFYQGMTLDYYNHSVIDSTHIYVAENGQATQGSWRDAYVGERGPLRVFGVNAAACLIARDFIESQPFDNLFDESFFMYLEDVDMALRACLLGWDSYCVPGATAYHMGSASSAENPTFSLRMTYRNNLPLLFKNLPIKMFLQIIPRAFKSDILTTRLLLRRGQAKGARALWKGRMIGLLRVLLYLSAHNTMQRNSVVDRDYLQKLMCKGY